MLEMAKGDAEWRNEMTAAERRELELAERTKAAATDQYKAVFTRLKNRCVQRLLRKRSDD